MTATVFYVRDRPHPLSQHASRAAEVMRPVTVKDVTDAMVDAAATAIAMYHEGFKPSEDDLIYARLALEAVFRGD